MLLPNSYHICKYPLSEESESALISFLSGGMGGLCSVFIGHPFDLVKVRIQTLNRIAASKTSVTCMIYKTIKQEGIRGMYRGMSAPLVVAPSMYAVSFWSYDVGKRIVRQSYEYFSFKEQQQQENKKNTHDEFEFTMTQICIAGGISAFPTTVLLAPSERIKCLLQVEMNEIEACTSRGTVANVKYKGMVDCVQQVYKAGGIRSVFKGTGATLLREIPGTMAFFGTYEYLKQQLLYCQNLPSTTSAQYAPITILTAGGLAGISCWTICIPFDVIKSRYQSAPDGKYRSLLHVYQQLMKVEGSFALMRGIKPALMRAFPANAAAFLGMEISRNLLISMRWS